MDVALQIVLDGTTYTLQVLPPEPFRPRVYSIAKPGQRKPYKVMAAVAGCAECSCPSFQYRKACKHLDALVEVGLSGPYQQGVLDGVGRDFSPREGETDHDPNG